MKKINMENFLFHSIIPYNINRYNPDKILNRTFKKLSYILDLKGILPREDLKHHLFEKDYKELIPSESPNCNGDNKVSICEHLTLTCKKAGFDINNLRLPRGEVAFELFTKNYCSIILVPKILNDLPVTLPSKRMFGELQVEGAITDDYFVGIALPNIHRYYDLEYVLNYITYGEDAIDSLPPKQMANDLLKLSEEKFVLKYYQEVIAYENFLKEQNSCLKLYHTETGEAIRTTEEEVEFVRKIKKTYQKYL